MTPPVSRLHQGPEGPGAVGSVDGSSSIVTTVSLTTTTTEASIPTISTTTQGTLALPPRRRMVTLGGFCHEGHGETLRGSDGGPEPAGLARGRGGRGSGGPALVGTLAQSGGTAVGPRGGRCGWSPAAMVEVGSASGRRGCGRRGSRGWPAGAWTSRSTESSGATVPGP